VSAIQVSRLVRLALEERWSAQFNDALAEIHLEYEIFDPAYRINFAEVAEQPQNFYRGAWSLEDLLRFREPDLPVMCLAVGSGIPYPPGIRSMPRAFSGYVGAQWRFYLAIRGRSGEKLTALREATEAAMLATIQGEFSEITYRGDLSWQPLLEEPWLDQDNKHAGFVQQVDYSASFEVNV
jgi:hypothetical protein